MLHNVSQLLKVALFLQVPYDLTNSQCIDDSSLKQCSNVHKPTNGQFATYTPVWYISH